MKPSKAYLLREMKDYLATVPDAAEQEHADQNVWVQKGNSPYSNPPILPMNKVGKCRSFTPSGQSENSQRIMMQASRPRQR